MKMQSSTISTILSIFFIMEVFSVTASPEPQKSPVAVVLSASGTVMIEYAGNSFRAGGATVLESGAIINPAAGASAIILFKNGKKTTVKSRFEVNAESSKITGDKSTRANAATEILFGTFSGSGGNSDLSIGGGFSGGLRLLSAETAAEEPALSINAYVNTAILDTKPTLSWTSTIQATGTIYIVSLSEIGGENIYKTEISGDYINFPETTPELKWGSEYKLSVSVKDNQKIETHGEFSLLSESDALEIKRLVSEIENDYSDGDDLTARYMLLVELYINHGLYSNAWTALGNLRRIDKNCGSYVGRRTMDLYNLTLPKNESDPAYDEIFK